MVTPSYYNPGCKIRTCHQKKKHLSNPMCQLVPWNSLIYKLKKRRNPESLMTVVAVKRKHLKEFVLFRGKCIGGQQAKHARWMTAQRTLIKNVIKLLNYADMKYLKGVTNSFVNNMLIWFKRTQSMTQLNWKLTAALTASKKFSKLKDLKSVSWLASWSLVVFHSWSWCWSMDILGYQSLMIDSS